MNTTHDSLIQALSNFPAPKTINVEYRIYYNKITGQCLFKTIDQTAEGSYITLSREEYDDIAFCPDYRIDTEHKLVKNKIEFGVTKLLRPSTNSEGFSTIKDDMIFRVDEGYTNRSTWTIGPYNYDDE